MPATRRLLTSRHALLGLVLLGACGSEQQTYYPLDAGRWWYYALDETVLDETRHARYVSANLGTFTLDGRELTAQASQARSIDYLRADNGAITRVAHRRPHAQGTIRDAAARVILPAVPSPGTRWRQTGTLGLIESRTFARADRVRVRSVPVVIDKQVIGAEAIVTVPAGTFVRCLEVAGTGHAIVRTDRGNSEASVLIEIREWYAPGVGLVRLERRESSQSPFLKSGYHVLSLVDFGD